MLGYPSGLPAVATAPRASSVSEYESLANCATASSNGPASAGKAKAAISRSANENARKPSQILVSTDATPAEVERRRRISPPLYVVDPSLRGAKRRSNPACFVALDCFAELVIGRAFARPVGSQ